MSITFEKVSCISEFLDIWLKNDLLSEDNQKVFDEYYASYKKCFFDRMKYLYARQTQDIIREINEKGILKILEVGCGCGTESLWMAMQGAEVTGIDVRDERLSVAKERLEIMKQYPKYQNIRCNFMNISLLDYSPNDKFDTIWLEQAFHHLEPRKEVIIKLAALLKHDGHLYVSEVNGLNVLFQIMLFKKRGFKTVKTYVDKNNKEMLYGDERILSGRKLTNLLNATGIKCESLYHWRMFPNGRWFEPLVSIEKNMPAFMKIFFTHYNYVGIKSHNTNDINNDFRISE